MLTNLQFLLYKYEDKLCPHSSPPAPGALAASCAVIVEPRLGRAETRCFSSQNTVVIVLLTITRLEIHVASRDRTKPKHDVSRSHRNIASHVVSLRVPRREPKHECNSDRDVDIDRAKLFDILSVIVFVLDGE